MRAVIVAVAVLVFVACESKSDEPPLGVVDLNKKNVVADAPEHESNSKRLAVEEQKSKVPPWADRTTKDSGFPCDVEQVLALSCRRCHWEPQENDAPFPLVKWDHTQAERSGAKIIDLMQKQVAADLMPPVEEMLSPPVTPLTEEQKQVLLSWLSSGGLRSSTTCP